MFMKNRIISAFVLTAMLALGACNKESDSGNDPQSFEKASVRFHLTDAPAEYDEVNINIQQVEVIMEGEASYTFTPATPGMYNLIELSNGVDVTLLRADIPAGNISQIRLILGDGNNVVIDGRTEPLNTPSAQQSGVKLNFQQRLEQGGAYDIWLDFDAGSSIVPTGSGKYNLKPVIRAYTAATDGRIKGYVLPLDANTTVYAMSNGETYVAIPDPTGFYMFTGLPSGSYDVKFDAASELYLDLTLNNISVSYGLTADLGTRVLVP